MKQYVLVVLPLALALAGCDSPTGSGGARISFPRGENLADTIGAEPATALRVKVQGADGRPAAAKQVIAAGVISGSGWARAPEIVPGTSTGGPYGPSSYATTDEDGIAEFRVRFGTKAGRGRLLVSVPSLAVMDTVRFTIRPGAAAAVRSFPADTMVRIGGTVRLTASVVDRGGNPVDGTVTFAASGTGGSVSNGMVSGTAFGRLAVVATAAGRSDTSYVSVVPPVTVAAYSRVGGTGDMNSLYTFDLDGANFRELRQNAVGRGYNGEMPAAWLGTNRLVYHDSRSDHTRQLYVLDLATGTASRFFPAASQMEMESYPRVSRDGSWVYFNGGSLADGWGIFRARADGTGKERLTPLDGVRRWLPTPSPDGREVAYIANGDYDAGDLEVLNLATRQTRKLASRAAMPRWSPDGTRIAYLARVGQVIGIPSLGELSVIRPDGTGERVVSRDAALFSHDIDWSPDGRFIVGTQRGRIALVEVATGITAPISLSFTNGMLVSPVWRP